MIKLLSLFSGIGAFEKSLRNLNIDFEVVNYCEIDKWASKSYCLINNEDENKNLWDIIKVNEKELLDFDLMTYGFPCQSYSVAGKRRGINDIKRGKLFFEALRIAKYKKPKYMIAENVKGLLSIHNGTFFKDILFELQKAGYNNYYKVLNAKDYGIPQNRERVFIVSIRKDIDDFNFEFPEKISLKLKLQDIIVSDYTEKNVVIVDDVYKNRTEREYIDYCPILRAEKCNELKVKIIDDKFKNSRKVREYEEYSSCLDSMVGGGRQPKVEIIYNSFEDKNKFNILNMGISNCLTPDAYLCRGERKRDENGNAILTSMNERRIRKLTPLECFRLMGFDDEDYYKCKNIGISNTQLYKQCGNSIVVNVLEAIFYKLFINRYTEVNKVF